MPEILPVVLCYVALVQPDGPDVKTGSASLGLTECDKSYLIIDGICIIRTFLNFVNAYQNVNNIIFLKRRIYFIPTVCNFVREPLMS